MKFLAFSLCITILNYVLFTLLVVKLKEKHKFIFPKSSIFDKVKTHLIMFAPILNIIVLVVILTLSDELEKRVVEKYGIAENSASTTE